MSLLYRQMEEDVAKKVRETMELADAKRRCLMPKDNKLTQIKPEDALQGQGLDQSDGSMDSSVRFVEVIASELTESENLRTSNATTAKQRFLAKDFRTIINIREKESNTPQFHIGFERIRDNVDKKRIGQTTALPAASNLLDNKRGLALGALRLAQTAAKDIDNQLYITDEDDKRQLAEGALNLAQTAAWNISNKPHETDDTNRRYLAEAALILAQSAAWNVDNKVHEKDETDKRQVPEGERVVSSAQGAAKRNTAEGKLNLALAEEALNLAKNAAWNIDNRLEANDKRGRARGALSLAQNAAWNINNKVHETEGDNRRIAEGALRLAQNAARDLGEVQTTNNNRRHHPQHPDKNVSYKSKDVIIGRRLPRGIENFEGGSFESITDSENQQNQKLQLGFDHIAAFHDEIRNDKELGEVLDEINKRSLAAYDKKTISTAEAQVRQLSEDLQNLEKDVENYDATEVEDFKKELVVGALNLAQMGARHISDEVQEANVSKIRELGEGALSLAQNAAKEQLSREGAHTSLEDPIFKNIIDLHKQRLQVRFVVLK